MGRAIRHRRVELGHHTIASFAKVVNLSTRLLGDLEAGKRDSYDPATLVRLEQALDWPPGQIDDILHASDPDPFAVLARLLEAHGNDLASLPPPTDFPEGSKERRTLEALAKVKPPVAQVKLVVSQPTDDGNQVWLSPDGRWPDDAPLPATLDEVHQLVSRIPPHERRAWVERYWQQHADPDPTADLMARVARHIHRDDFVLAWLLAHADLSERVLWDLELYVRRRREQQNVELLRDLEGKIREEGGTVSYPWDTEAPGR